VILHALESRDIPSRLIAADGVVYADSGSFQPFAYYRGPLHVSLSPDLNGDGIGDIIVGAGPGGGPRVAAFGGRDTTILANFFAFEPSLRGGVRVAVDGERGELLTAAGEGGAGVVASYSLADWRETSRTLYGSPDYRGGATVDADPLRPMPSLTVGRGPLAVYLDLGLSADESAFVVGQVGQILAPLSDLVRITNQRPIGYVSDYITAAVADLSYFPVPVSGLATATLSNRQPSSFFPIQVFADDTLPIDYLPVVLAHEIMHTFGLSHNLRTGNLMNAPASRDALLDVDQIATARTSIYTFAIDLFDSQ
jgi:hypothetical protein